MPDFRPDWGMGSLPAAGAPSYRFADVSHAKASPQSTFAYLHKSLRTSSASASVALFRRPVLPRPFVQSTLAFDTRNISVAKVFTWKQQVIPLNGSFEEENEFLAVLSAVA